MSTIEIDFEVYKKLTALRETEETSYNDVIRSLLDLDQRTTKPAPPTHAPGQMDFVSKGVHFPHGTKFRKVFKGQAYYAEIIDGKFMYDGKEYTSPSSAAMAVTKNPVNGWTFWQAQKPGKSDWITISSFRHLKIDEGW
jgi:hypothetical protein